MATIQQGVRIAKQLRKKNPKLKWTDAIRLAHKKAGKPGKKKAAPKKKVYKRKVSGVTTKSKSHTDKNRITANIQLGSVTMAQLKSETVKRLEDKIGKLMVKKVMATRKTEKAKHQKEITRLLTEIKRQKSI